VSRDHTHPHTQNFIPTPLLKMQERKEAQKFKQAPRSPQTFLYMVKSLNSMTTLCPSNSGILAMPFSRKEGLVNMLLMGCI